MTEISGMPWPHVASDCQAEATARAAFIWAVLGLLFPLLPLAMTVVLRRRAAAQAVQHGVTVQRWCQAAAAVATAALLLDLAALAALVW